MPNHFGLLVFFLFRLLFELLTFLYGFSHEFFFFGALGLLCYPQRLLHFFILDGSLGLERLLLLVKQLVRIFLLLFFNLLGRERRLFGLLRRRRLFHVLDDLFFEQHFHGLFVELGIPLTHQFLECDEVVDGNDLVDKLFVDRVLVGLVARLQELLLSDAKFREQMPDQLLDELLELTVHWRVLQLIFFLVVEDNAVVVQEAHDWRLPTGRPQEINDDIEEPIVLAFSCILLRGRRAALWILG